MDKTKKSPVKLIMVILSGIVLFVLLGTMLIDFLLVSLKIKPLFASIVTDKSESGEVIVGKGLLYTTLERSIVTPDGKVWGVALYPGYDKRVYNEEIISKIPMRYYTNDGKSYALEATGDKEENEFDNSSDDIEEIADDSIFNMDSVRSLADGEISFRDFMAKYPGNEVKNDDGSTLYHVALPNHYAVEIEYKDETVNYMRLYDKKLAQYIDLQTQNIDIFLLERGE